MKKSSIIQITKFFVQKVSVANPDSLHSDPDQGPGFVLKSGSGSMLFTESGSGSRLFFYKSRSVSWIFAKSGSRPRTMCFVTKNVKFTFEKKSNICNQKTQKFLFQQQWRLQALGDTRNLPRVPLKARKLLIFSFLRDQFHQERIHWPNRNQSRIRIRDPHYFFIIIIIILYSNFALGLHGGVDVKWSGGLLVLELHFVVRVKVSTGTEPSPKWDRQCGP